MKVQSKRRTSRKITLINMFGGKCSICGYNKCIAALQFHHIDPSTKKHQLSMRQTGQMSWDDILEEAKKCQLLCANCHAELHYAKGSTGTRTLNT